MVVPGDLDLDEQFSFSQLLSQSDGTWEGQNSATIPGNLQQYIPLNSFQNRADDLFVPNVVAPPDHFDALLSQMNPPFQSNPVPTREQNPVCIFNNQL
jgi:hypothetical protein